MNSMEQFHFLRPYWLLALVLLMVLLLLMIKRKLGSRSWENVCDESLLPYVLIGTGTRTRQLSIVLTALGGLFAIVALSGPVWEKLPQPVFTSQSSLVIALDLSRSMDADDINPSRLARARYKIADILSVRQEGQTALIVYAQDSYTVTPLTDDVATILSQLNALTTDIMPVQGNGTDNALIKSMELLKQGGVKNGDILFISDEINFEQAAGQAEKARRQGYRVSVMGVGTEHGVPIPLADGSFLKDHNGRIVVPVLDEAPMHKLAAEGGGKYIQMVHDDKDVKTLQQFFSSNRMNSEIEATELKTDVWKERGPWLLIVLLPLMALMFRRGYLVALMLCLLPFPDQVMALDWDSLWLRKDQQAKLVMDAGDNETAAELFQDPAWKGSARYRAGEFGAAIEALELDTTTESQYNKGNALARLGRYHEAIDVYKEVLEQLPDHEDALYNKELLEQELEQEKQQQQEDQQQNGEQQSQDDGQGDEQDENSGQQQSESSEGEDTDSDQQQNSAADEQQQNAEDDQQRQQGDSQQGSQEQDNEEENRNQEQQMASSDTMTPDEQQQATEQWLRRIPDDPGGLLRRKFRYQYQQGTTESKSDNQSW